LVPSTHCAGAARAGSTDMQTRTASSAKPIFFMVAPFTPETFAKCFSKDCHAPWSPAIRPCSNGDFHIYYKYICQRP